MTGGLGPTASQGRTALASERAFLGACALLFLVCAGVTIYWSESMSGGMTMPGGWTLPMVWTRMPEQTWPSAAATFMGMWLVMMAAMMLPSQAPMILHYRHTAYSLGAKHPSRLAVLAGAGYFCVWAIVGAAVYPLGALLAAAEMQWMGLASLAPFATGIVLLAVGCVQLTTWKARQLKGGPDLPVEVPAQFPEAHSASLARSAWFARSAWQFGLRAGWQCFLCCAGLMLILIATGVMDIGVMAAIAAAITLEQLAPAGELVARGIGVAAILAGVFMILHALGLL